MLSSTIFLLTFRIIDLLSRTLNGTASLPEHQPNLALIVNAHEHESSSREIIRGPAYFTKNYIQAFVKERHRKDHIA